MMKDKKIIAENLAFQQFSSQVACNGLKAHLDFKFIESKDKKVNNKNVNEDAHVSVRHIAKIADEQSKFDQ